MDFDLPPQIQETGEWLVMNNHRFLFTSPQPGNYVAAFTEFGRPKELLIVGGNGEVRLQQNSTQLKGWEKIEFVEHSNSYEPQKSEGILQYVNDNWYYMTEDVLWFRERLPDVRIVSVKKEGESLRKDQQGSQLLILAD